MATTTTESPVSTASPGSPATPASPRSESPKPNRLSRVLGTIKNKVSNHRSSSPSGDLHPKGKASQRHEAKQEEKAEKQQRVREEEDSLELKRKEEQEEAKREETPEFLAKYGELQFPAELIPIQEVEQYDVGQEVTFRARIHTQRKISAAIDFLLFREQQHSIQGVLSRTSEHMIRWVKHLPPESIVQVSGTLQTPREPVQSATIHHLEVHIDTIHLVAESHHIPFDLYHTYNDKSLASHLSNRILDLRHPSNQAIFRIRSKVMQVFRQTMDNKGFIEISTPKLQPAATESGASVFKVGYFGRTAFLAQSPQLAKQMAISADFEKVYEVGPVFRAENSNTHRHLTEYTGLDIEMAIKKDYHEILRTLDDFLKSVFASILQMRTEVDTIRERFPCEDLVWLEETPVLPFMEGIQMLRDDGRDVEVEDLSTRDEIRLGELVKEKYKTDFYVLDKFPISARPFYTHNDGEWTHSFDMFVRGQEICTGGQRIHDPANLRAAMKESGIDEGSMEEYLQAFDWGTPPHGGAGLGLERIVFLLLNLGNVRHASLFHRDPKSLPFRPPSLPHPEASTAIPHPAGKLPPVEDLIANYGDATNTSWLDDRFEIWRAKNTGAAMGYVKQKKFAMIAGDPLCEPKQYSETIDAFLSFVTDELKLTPVWLLCGAPVQHLLGEKLGWRTFTCTEEQRVDLDKQVIPEAEKDERKVEREGVEIKQVQPTSDVQEKVDQRISDWKESRKTKGKQVHLTEIAPWKDPNHRKYFLATSKDGRPEAMVVLAQLSPVHGWQVKWALDFPNSPNGVIEVLVAKALQSISGPVTFGAGVSEKLVPGSHINGAKARFMAKTYTAVVRSLHLRNKATFREKFGTHGEPVYICFPKHGVKMGDLNEIVKFFED